MPNFDKKIVMLQLDHTLRDVSHSIISEVISYRKGFTSLPLTVALPVFGSFIKKKETKSKKY